MGGWGVPPVDERRVSRGLLSRRPELAGHPAHGVGLQGIDGEGNFLDQMAGAALESTLLKATFAWRDPSQSHPVLAGRTRWPLSNRNAHHPVSRANDRRGWEFWSVRFPTFSDKNLAQFLNGGEPQQKIRISSTGHGWMRDRHGLGPEAPLSPKGRVVLVWVQQT